MKNETQKNFYFIYENITYNIDTEIYKIDVDNKKITYEKKSIENINTTFFKNNLKNNTKL